MDFVTESFLAIKKWTTFYILSLKRIAYPAYNGSIRSWK